VSPAAPPAAPVVLPHVTIDLHDGSLSDWPKPASLLPPLQASPGAVGFGEIYLSWNERGLALATIGQDYFDLDLLPYEGPFPLGEAYRIEIGTELDGSIRRATLFFIPGRGDRFDHQTMTTKLCAGAAAVVIAQGCQPVEGAEAVYFGADQPRITAELLLPWGALGIAAPSPGARFRAEVAVTSWHRDRWISLSGEAPDRAMADPAHWRAMRLGDGLAVTAPAPRAGAPG